MLMLNVREAQAAENQVLSRAGRLTPGGLRAAIKQAVMDVAPEKARKLREHAARDARVERWGEDSGNGALAGRELPRPGCSPPISARSRKNRATASGGRGCREPS
jgi:hypothetical protein